MKFTGIINILICMEYPGVCRKIRFKNVKNFLDEVNRNHFKSTPICMEYILVCAEERNLEQECAPAPGPQTAAGHSRRGICAGAAGGPGRGGEVRALSVLP